MIAIGLMAFVTSADAQALQEIVYLKNGSIIRGVIVEQIPGTSLKIQTDDGSVFAYSMSEIEKITKDAKSKSQRATASNSNSSFSVRYRGLVDVGYTLGVGLGQGIDRIDVFTSHGVQIIPQLYIGGGVGFGYYYDASEIAVPIFANIRTDILQSNITPFVDLKIGYSVTGITGFYLSPTLGCKIGHFNIGLGYTMQKLNIEGWDFGNIGGLSLKVGFDF